MFLAEGWIDVIASDNHARPGRRPSLRKVRDDLKRQGLDGPALLLLSENPRRILADEMPLPVGPAEVAPAGLLERVWRVLTGGV